MITYESPVGQLYLARTEVGLIRLGFGNVESVDEFVADVLARVGDEGGHEHCFDNIRTALDSYFAYGNEIDSITVDWRHIAGFHRRALAACQLVSIGRTLTYGQLAERLGSPNACRAVGSAMATNPIPIVLPCHRIVRSDKSLGGYLGGVDVKAKLIELEFAHSVPAKES